MYGSLLLSLSKVSAYVSFIDDFSKFVWIVPLTNKWDVFNAFVEFRALVFTQYNKHIKFLHSDLEGGGGWLS